MAASMKNMLTVVRTCHSFSRWSTLSKIKTNVNKNVNYTLVRSYGFNSKSTIPTMKDLWKRRRAQGPDPERPRSIYPNWNYDAELYAFGKRLGEDFNDETLRQAFTHSSYIETEINKRKELGLESQDSLSMADNQHFISTGRNLTSSYIKAYVRFSYPALPEECVQSIHDYLTEEEMIAMIGSHIGVKDLILCQEFPVQLSTIADTFYSVVGALSHDQGDERAHLFVQDFVVAQLVDKDLSDIWRTVIHDPMHVLTDLLQKQGQHPPEPRELHAFGTGTILAAYHVGLYSNKQLIGKGYGETATIAEEMAAVDALKHIWGTSLSAAPLSLGKKGRQISIDLNKTNSSLQDYTVKSITSS